jgi:hypothetical protein
MFKMDRRDEPADLPSFLILFHHTGFYQLLILESKSRHLFQRILLDYSVVAAQAGVLCILDDHLLCRANCFSLCTRASVCFCGFWLCNSSVL